MDEIFFGNATRSSMKKTTFCVLMQHITHSLVWLSRIARKQRCLSAWVLRSKKYYGNARGKQLMEEANCSECNFYVKMDEFQMQLRRHYDNFIVGPGAYISVFFKFTVVEWRGD